MVVVDICNVCGNDFRCLFCFNYVLLETEGLVERSFFLDAVVKGR